MAEQEEQGSEWPKSLRARIDILAYILAFIFLCVEGSRLSNMPIQVVGILFLVAAFLKLIGQLPFVLLKRIAKFADYIFTLPMYLIVIALFIKEVLNLANFTEQVKLIWAIPVVILGFIVYDITRIVKDTRENARLRGKKVTAIKRLKLLTWVLLVFALVLLASDIHEIGSPIFWLTLSAVISLTIALFLDGTFKKQD